MIRLCIAAQILDQTPSDHRLRSHPSQGPKAHSEATNIAEMRDREGASVGRVVGDLGRQWQLWLSGSSTKLFKQMDPSGQNNR